MALDDQIHGRSAFNFGPVRRLYRIVIISNGEKNNSIDESTTEPEPNCYPYDTISSRVCRSLALLSKNSVNRNISPRGDCPVTCETYKYKVWKKSLRFTSSGEYSLSEEGSSFSQLLVRVTYTVRARIKWKRTLKFARAAVEELSMKDSFELSFIA